MVVGCGIGHLAMETCSADLLGGELHVLVGACRAVLLDDPVLGDALAEEIVLHARALGDDLVGTAAAGGDEEDVPSCFLLLCLRKGQGTVQPRAQQRRGRTVPADTAAENDQIILVVLRPIARCNQTGDERADQHTLKIQIDSREKIGKQIVEHHLLLRAGDKKIVSIQSDSADHKQQRENDPEYIDKSLSLMPDQRYV